MGKKILLESMTVLNAAAEHVIYLLTHEGFVYPFIHPQCCANNNYLALTEKYAEVVLSLEVLI